MNLTANHMRGPWSEVYIMGFVSKNRAEELLLAMEGGVFLLRFSDSELGGVTIAYVRQVNGKKTVLMLVPFTVKELSQQSISDKIFDLQQHLTTLYPDTPVEAFRKFINPSAQTPPSSNGYVPHMLKTHVVGVDGVSSPVSPARNDVSVNRTSN